MRTIIQLVISLVCFAAVVGCAPVSQKHYLKKGISPLTREQIEATIAGTALHLASIDFNATVTFTADNKLQGKSHIGGEDSGRWQAEEKDLLCMQFSSWYYGDNKCYRMIVDGDRILFFTSNGALNYTGTKLKKHNSRINYSQQNQDSSVSTVRAETEATRPETAEEKKKRFARMAKNCPGCNLSGFNLSGANLIRANLARANLSGADLSNTELRQANLSGADLSGAIVIRANLPGADLSGANLTNSDFSGSNLIRANVTGATIVNTNFTGAYLESIEGKIQ